MMIMKWKDQVNRLRVLTPPLPWSKSVVDDSSSNEVVIMLHGLWRSSSSMQPLAKYLFDKGYTTVRVPYPSFRYPLDELVRRVQLAILPWLESGKNIHFVTHSLGGVIVKRLLEILTEDELQNINRVVMLAPPHKGSEIVDWLKNSSMGPFKKVLGPAGDFLSSEKMSLLNDRFCSNVEPAVIMGNKSSLPFFRRLLDELNDGIVSVERGRVTGIKEFKVVDSDHTFITCDDKVMQLTADFLNNGKCK